MFDWDEKETREAPPEKELRSIITETTVAAQACRVHKRFLSYNLFVDYYKADNREPGTSQGGDKQGPVGVSVVDDSAAAPLDSPSGSPDSRVSTSSVGPAGRRETTAWNSGSRQRDFGALNSGATNPVAAPRSPAAPVPRAKVRSRPVVPPWLFVIGGVAVLGYIGVRGITGSRTNVAVPPPVVSGTPVATPASHRAAQASPAHRTKHETAPVEHVKQLSVARREPTSHERTARKPARQSRLLDTPPRTTHTPAPPRAVHPIATAPHLARPAAEPIRQVHSASAAPAPERDTAEERANKILNGG